MESRQENTMNFRSKLVAIAGSALILASSIGAGSAATSANASVEIQAKQGATLSVSITDATFTAVNYSFKDETSTGKLVVTASDPRGTGAGWNVTLKGQNFKTSDGARSIPIGNLSLAAGTQTGLTPAEAKQPSSITGMQTFAVPGVSSGNTKIWNAQTLSGMGEYKSEMEGTLTVPAGTLIGTYTAQVEVAIQTGP